MDTVTILSDLVIKRQSQGSKNAEYRATFSEQSAEVASWRLDE